MEGSVAILQAFAHFLTYFIICAAFFSERTIIQSRSSIHILSVDSGEITEMFVGSNISSPFFCIFFCCCIYALTFIWWRRGELRVRTCRGTHWLLVHAFGIRERSYHLYTVAHRGMSTEMNTGLNIQ